MATITVRDGLPYAYWNGVGLLPARGASPRDAQLLSQVVAFAELTGNPTTTVPGLNVVPDTPEVEEKRRIGFV